MPAACDERAQSTRRPDWFVHGVGWFGIAFFGLATLASAARFFDNRPALIIDRTGIVDQLSWFSVGRIPWPEIRGFGTERMKGQRFLVVDVRNPRQFIDRGNVLGRWLRAANARLVGSPVALSSIVLDISFDELVLTVGRFFDQTRAPGRQIDIRKKLI